MGVRRRVNSLWEWVCDPKTAETAVSRGVSVAVRNAPMNLRTTRSHWGLQISFLNLKTTNVDGGSCVTKLVQDFLKVDNKIVIDSRVGSSASSSRRCKASTRETWPAAPLHFISHNVFRVHLTASENNVLVVLLLSATTNSVFRENRVKRSARCGCIVGRSSLTIV
jgi:hypothetical protein